MSSPPLDLCAVEAGTLARLVRERTVSPVEVVEAALARQAELDGHLHAFCTPTPELARATARHLEAELSAGRPSGRWRACRSRSRI